MGNCCEGQLKIRGKGEDIFKFFKECIKGVQNSYDERGWFSPVWFDIVDYEYHHTEDVREYCYWSPKAEYGKYKNVNRNQFYLKDSDENFYFGGDFGKIRFYSSEMDEEIIKSWYIISDHSLKTENLVKLSKKYNLDFRFFGFDSGYEYNQEVEIIKGVVVKSEIIRYEDYNWESPFNDIGG